VGVLVHDHREQKRHQTHGRGQKIRRHRTWSTLWV
jgi:hypothetical protein